jgi:hypothetical protein
MRCGNCRYVSHRSSTQSLWGDIWGSGKTGMWAGTVFVQDPRCKTSKHGVLTDCMLAVRWAVFDGICCICFTLLFICIYRRSVEKLNLDPKKKNTLNAAKYRRLPVPTKAAASPRPTRMMGFLKKYQRLKAPGSGLVHRRVKQQLTRLFDCPNWLVTNRLSTGAALDTGHLQNMKRIFKLAHSGQSSGCRCFCSLGTLTMLGMDCCNSSFAFGSVGARSSTAMKLALLGF